MAKNILLLIIHESLGIVNIFFALFGVDALSSLTETNNMTQYENTAWKLVVAYFNLFGCECVY